MAEQVFRRLAGLLRKCLAQELDVTHAVDAKEAEVIAQLAPRCGGPKRRIEPEAQWTNLAARLGALLVEIAEPNFPAAANRGAQLSKVERDRHPPHVLRRPQRSIIHHPMQMRRQHVLHLRQCRVGRAAQLGVAPVLHHASAEHERLELVLAEHERRQIVALAQRVADTGGALDWNLARNQVADVAIDSALADVEMFRERSSGHYAASAQPLNDLEEAIGATHNS